MKELTYHNQLIVKKTIEKNRQLEVMKSLLKMGLTTSESVNLFESLLVSVQMNEEQKLDLQQSVDQWILNDSTKEKVHDLLKNR